MEDKNYKSQSQTRRFSEKNVYIEAASNMREARKKYSSAIVSFSGGKDSMVILDMVAKAGFEKIVAFILEFVPGLEIVKKQIDYAKSRYGVDVYQFQDPAIFSWLEAANYNDRNRTIEEYAADLKKIQIVPIVRNDTGIQLVVTGHKKSDGLNQGVMNAQNANKDDGYLQPIINWNKYHVYSYLKSNNIPIPESDGRNSSSMDLHPRNIFWLYEKHNADYQKLKRVFPYVEAIIKRKKWYDLPSY
jgi:3'-phosphoadenosine 5'-phosphosulfate sulfotransferase (PAPS reductase)/FAD synthetase